MARLFLFHYDALERKRRVYYDKEKLTCIQRHLDEIWPLPRPCPICRRNPDHWRVSETPVLLPLLTGRAEISLHDFKQAAESLAVAPAVALTCSECGHILLFNAARLGVASVEPGVEGRFCIPSK